MFGVQSRTYARSMERTSVAIAGLLSLLVTKGSAQTCGFPWTLTATPASGNSVVINVCGSFVGCRPQQPTGHDRWIPDQHHAPKLRAARPMSVPPGCRHFSGKRSRPAPLARILHGFSDSLELLSTGGLWFNEFHFPRGGVVHSHPGLERRPRVGGSTRHRRNVACPKMTLRSDSASPALAKKREMKSGRLPPAAESTPLPRLEAALEDETVRTP